jgi:hypothetical protein
LTPFEKNKRIVHFGEKATSDCWDKHWCTDDIIAKIQAGESNGFIRKFTNKFFNDFTKSFFLNFDIEVGTLTTFYSRTHPERGNLALTEEKIEYCEKNEVRVISKISLVGQRKDNVSLMINDNIQLKSNRLRRTVKFEVTEDSIIRDMVVRYILNPTLIRFVAISGKRFKHKSSNKYRQFETEYAEINTNTGSIEVKSCKKISDNGLQHKFGDYLYFRDEPEGDYHPAPWIFHSRFLVKEPAVYCFKGCSSYFNKPFPSILDKGLQRFELHKIFLDFRERITQLLPFQAHGAVKVCKGTIFEIEDEWVWK